MKIRFLLKIDTFGCFGYFPKSIKFLMLRKRRRTFEVIEMRDKDIGVHIIDGCWTYFVSLHGRVLSDSTALSFIKALKPPCPHEQNYY